jgi:hypothetical protein
MPHFCFSNAFLALQVLFSGIAVAAGYQENKYVIIYNRLLFCSAAKQKKKPLHENA